MIFHAEKENHDTVDVSNDILIDEDAIRVIKRQKRFGNLFIVSGVIQSVAVSSIVLWVLERTTVARENLRLDDYGWLDLFGEDIDRFFVEYWIYISLGVVASALSYLSFLWIGHRIKNGSLADYMILILALFISPSLSILIISSIFTFEALDNQPFHYFAWFGSISCSSAFSIFLCLIFFIRLRSLRIN